MLRTLPIFVMLPILAVAAPAPKEKNALYFASKVGDKLVYEHQDQDHKNERTEVVTHVEHKDGRLIVTISREWDGKSVGPMAYEVSPKGLHMNAGVTSRPHPLLKLPAKAGDSWLNGPESTDHKGYRSTSTITQTDVDIEVPAGKFKTIRVETHITVQDQRLTNICWYAPNVGLVKRITTLASGERTQTLKSFTPGK
ncbi:hypothetical protein [Zavarzinella formosa]|uniref:hypothetical protein n=1 Tax=Zavarzinella formosa TaxID=360055 RepID=UPI00038163A3|nr:hypothetical protein [Zavarzinella formosa]